MVNFTTFFDRNYLSRGIVLYESLKSNCTTFRLYVLCLDDEVFDYFHTNQEKYSNIVSLKLGELELDDNDLLKAKSNRSKIEYYFTLSPCLPLYLLKKFSLPHICSLDADIMFFGSVEPIFKLLQDFSIIITPHKFSKALEQDGRDRYGKFNVSFQIFKNDVIGLSCLKDWRSKCINWCYDSYDETNGGRFADQKYLDTWHEDYAGKVYSLDDPTEGLAVWNIDNYEFTLCDSLVCSDGKPIIFYHFAHFKILSDRIALNGFDEYKVSQSCNTIANDIYLPYWNNLIRFNKIVKQHSDLSIRQSLNAKKWKQIIISGTLFFKFINRNYSFNIVLFRDFVFLLKKYGPFNRS